MTTNEAKETLERFREEYINKRERQISTGLGRAPGGGDELHIQVTIYTDNKHARKQRAEELRAAFPEEFEGLPIRVEGQPMPVLF